MRTVRGKKFFKVFLKVQSLVHLFLTWTYFIFWMESVVSYAETKMLVIKEIEHFPEFYFQWFDFNYMKINRSNGTSIQEWTR